MASINEIEPFGANRRRHAGKPRAQGLDQLAFGSCAEAQWGDHAPHPREIRVERRHPADDMDGRMRASESVHLSGKTGTGDIERMRREYVWVEVREDIPQQP